jgi:predicted nucleic acid-binding protein
MIRVVLDTNILVSALLQPLGPPAQVERGWSFVAFGKFVGVHQLHSNSIF